MEEKQKTFVNEDKSKMTAEKFTVKETARMVRRSPDTIYRWIEEGFLENFIKVRDGYLIPKTEIDRILVIISPQK